MPSDGAYRPRTLSLPALDQCEDRAQLRSANFAKPQGFIAILSGNTSRGSLPPSAILHRGQRLSDPANHTRRSHSQAPARFESTTSRCGKVNRLQRNDDRELGKGAYLPPPHEIFCHQNVFRPVGEGMACVVRSLAVRSLLSLIRFVVERHLQLGLEASSFYRSIKTAAAGCRITACAQESLVFILCSVSSVNTPCCPNLTACSSRGMSRAEPGRTPWNQHEAVVAH